MLLRLARVHSHAPPGLDAPLAACPPPAPCVQFGLSLTVAGALGSIFGLMNLFTRATGGMISDLVALRWGMRGRIWALWIIQTLGGAFCIGLDYADKSLSSTIILMVGMTECAQRGLAGMD
jgi:nitrate/nitrite transporter NarK